MSFIWLYLKINISDFRPILLDHTTNIETEVCLILPSYLFLHGLCVQEHQMGMSHQLGSDQSGQIYHFLRCMVVCSYNVKVDRSWSHYTLGKHKLKITDTSCESVLHEVSKTAVEEFHSKILRTLPIRW